MVLEFFEVKFRGGEQNYHRIRCVKEDQAVAANSIPAPDKAVAFDWRVATPEEVASAPKDMI